MKQLKKSAKNSSKSSKSRQSRHSTVQSGIISNLGISLMILLVFATIGFALWAVQRNRQPTLVYTPPPVTADTALTSGKSSKELIQDVKVLEASVKRGDSYMTNAKAVLDDKIYTGSDNTGVDQAQASITDLQSTFIKESNRRIQALTKAQPLLVHLTASQRPAVEQLINSEITILNNLKSKVVTTTDNNGILALQQSLNQEYDNYLLSLSQANLLTWANDQSIMADKFNKVGGKFQERADQASNAGQSIAAIQSLLNSYQANKQTTRESFADVIKLVPTIRPGESNAKRSVLKTYSVSLSTGQNELVKALATAKQLAIAFQQLGS